MSRHPFIEPFMDSSKTQIGRLSHRALPLLFGLVLFLGLLPAEVLALSGTIHNVLGQARIVKRTGQQAPAIKGDNLYEGDTVITAPVSNVQIRMVDEATIWLRPSTEFRIDTYRSTQRGDASNEARLHLLAGSMRTITGAISPTRSGSYALSTPVATMGIRGTEFDAVHATAQYAAQLNIQQGTYNRVYEGTTTLSGASASLTLNAGQAGFIGVQPGASPSGLAPIPPFLNLPPDTTALTGTPAGPTSTPTPAPPVSAGPRAIQLTMWLGELGSNDPSTSNDSPDKRVRLEEGVPALWDLSRAMSGPYGNPPGPGVQQYASMRVLVRFQGNNVRLEFTPTSNVNVIGSSSTVSTSASSLDLPSARWTEVTGRGPWRAPNRTVTGTRRVAEPKPIRVYLKIDDIP